ncbi:MAG: histidine triad nucleotide-binding protein [Elusimicrobiota bacterium]|jgi:histidine triad (HIT) family protein|nr:histidine triad nucleotide-binding protein [Elusimicrobiota bacterium]
MEKDCIFCKIAKKEVPATIIYEDETAIAFSDLSPRAPIHIIVIPKLHINKLSEVSAADQDLLGHLQVVIAEISRKIPQMKDGFRVILNCGQNGGQTVGHLHYHLLGGRELKWTPG